MLRPPYRMGRVGLHGVPGHQPIEEHSDRSEVLFDGRLRVRAAELLDIRRDVHRRHTGEISQTSLFTPGGEALDSLEVGAAGICIPDVDREELPEAPATLRHGLEEHWQCGRCRPQQRNGAHRRSFTKVRYKRISPFSRGWVTGSSCQNPSLLRTEEDATFSGSQ